jgi:hypothetical protein
MFMPFSRHLPGLSRPVDIRGSARGVPPWPAERPEVPGVIDSVLATPLETPLKSFIQNDLLQLTKSLPKRGLPIVFKG